jgi:hypothetical protein
MVVTNELFYFYSRVARNARYYRGVCLKYFVFLALIGLLLIVGLFSFTYMHELVHVQNFKADGVDSHIEFRGTVAYTIPDSNVVSVEVNNRLKLENSFNEAVAYNVAPLVLMVCATMVLCSIYLKGDKE